MPTATVTSKRQITLPAETCRDLRIVPGSRIDFVKNAAGEIVVRPKAGDVRALKGFIKYDGPPASLDDIENGIAAEIARRRLPE
jgi:antitoxin PrlF